MCVQCTREIQRKRAYALCNAVRWVSFTLVATLTKLRYYDTPCWNSWNTKIQIHLSHILPIFLHFVFAHFSMNSVFIFQIDLTDHCHLKWSFKGAHFIINISMVLNLTILIVMLIILLEFVLVYFLLLLSSFLFFLRIFRKDAHSFCNGIESKTFDLD